MYFRTQEMQLTKLLQKEQHDIIWINNKNLYVLENGFLLTITFSYERGSVANRPLPPA